MSHSVTWPQPTSALQPDCPHSCPCALDWAYPGPLAITKAKHTLSRLYVLSLLVPPLPRVPCPNHSCVCVFFPFSSIEARLRCPSSRTPFLNPTTT